MGFGIQHDGEYRKYEGNGHEIIGTRGGEQFIESFESIADQEKVEAQPNFYIVSTPDMTNSTITNEDSGINDSGAGGEKLRYSFRLQDLSQNVKILIGDYMGVKEGAGKDVEATRSEQGVDGGSIELGGEEEEEETEESVEESESGAEMGVNPLDYVFDQMSRSPEGMNMDHLCREARAEGLKGSIVVTAVSEWVREGVMRVDGPRVQWAPQHKQWAASLMKLG